MKKYLPLLIATFATMAFVGLKKSVTTALPGINKMIKGCPSELDDNKERLLRPEERQAKENTANRDSITGIVFIREYTSQNDKEHGQKQKIYFTYKRCNTNVQCDLGPACQIIHNLNNCEDETIRKRP